MRVRRNNVKRGRIRAFGKPGLKVHRERIVANVGTEDGAGLNLVSIRTEDADGTETGLDRLVEIEGDAVRLLTDRRSLAGGGPLDNRVSGRECRRHQ